MQVLLRWNSREELSPFAENSVFGNVDRPDTSAVQDKSIAHVGFVFADHPTESKLTKEALTVEFATTQFPSALNKTKSHSFHLP